MPGGVNLGSASGKIIIDHGQATTGIGQVQRGLLGLQSGFLGLSGPLAVAAGGLAAFGLAGAGAAVGLGKSIGAAADLEQQMSGIQAVMGATQEELAQLEELTTRLGLDPNLTVSATEAAAAIEVLGRNGLEVSEILGGAAEGAIALANATGGTFASSADVATDVLSIFGIKASEMSEAVNGITGVVNNSKFTLDDYRLALAQGGQVVASAGVSFDEFNAAIAATASSFSSGSDAGTSFRTFVSRLIPQSDKAAGVMADLGLIVDGNNQFFDTATGEIKSMAEISGILQNALSGLSEEQRLSALQTLFGADAFRTAAALAEVGSEKFKEFQDTVANTSAADAAATRMDNLRGDLDILNGVLETLSLSTGKLFIPTVRKLVQAFTEFLSGNSDRIIDFFEFLAEKADAGVDAFLLYGPALLAFGRYIAAVVQTGDEFNDFLTHLPEPLQELAIETGEAINRLRDFFETARRGGRSVAGFGQQIRSAFDLGGIVAVGGFLGGQAEELGRSLGQAIADGVRFILNNRQEATEIMSAFIESLALAVPGILTNIRLTGRQISTGFITGFIEGISGKEVSTEVAGAISSGLGALSLALPLGSLFGLPGVLLSIAGALAVAGSQIPEVREFFSGLATDARDLFDTLTQGEGPLADFATTAGGAIGELGSVAGNVQQFIADLRAGFDEGRLEEVFWAWVDRAVENAPTNINAILDTIIDLLESGRTELAPFLDKYGDQFWSWVSNVAIPQAANRLSGLSQTISQWAASDEGSGQLQEVGRQLGLALMEGLQRYVGNTERAAELAAALTKGLLEVSATSNTAFIDIASNIGSGVIAGIVEFFTGEEASQETLDALTEFLDRWLSSGLYDAAGNLGYELGSNFVNRLIEGVRAGIDELGNAVGEIVDEFNPLQGIELPRFLQRKSPSPLEQTFMGLNDLLSSMPSIPDTLGLNGMPALAAVAPGGAASAADVTTTTLSIGDVILPNVTDGDPKQIGKAIREELQKLFGKSYKPR